MRKLFLLSTIYCLLSTSVKADWPMFRQNIRRTGFFPETGKLESVNLRWEYTIPGMVGCMRYASPALADIDDDDTMEIVIAASMNGLFVFSANPLYALLTLEWTYPTSSYLTTTPLLFDVNKDNKIEVVFGSFNDTLYTLDGTGNLLWSFGTQGPINSSPVTGDIDNDDTIEVIVGSWDSYVYVLNGYDGTLKWSYKTGGSIESSPALADINQDDTLEILIGSNDGKLYCLQVSSGTLDSLWTYEAGGSIQSTPAIGDLNKDDTLDIVFGCYDGGVHAVSGAAQDLLWFFPTAGYIDHQSAGLADIDNDTYLEVVIGSFDGNTLYVIDGETGTENWSKTFSNPAASSPAIADIDSDLELEIVMAIHNEYYYAWNANGDEQWKWRYTNGDQDCPPALGDVDGDGQLEVVGTDIAYSKVFVLDWPDSMAGIEENSNIKYQNAKLEVYPNPFTKKTVISYQLSVISKNLKPITDYRLPITLGIYDLTGRLIRSLPITDYQLPITAVTWDRTDEAGNKVPSGIYFCKLSTVNRQLSTTKKLVCIK